MIQHKWKPKRPKVTPPELVRMGLGKRFWNAKLADIPKRKQVKQDRDLRHVVEHWVANLPRMVRKGWGLYLWGANSTGKSYAMAVCAKAAYVAGYSVFIITADMLKDAVIKRTMWDEDEELTIIERCNTVDVLVIEDLGKEYKGSGSGFSETALENLLRIRSQNQLVTMATSNLSTKQFKDVYGLSAAELAKAMMKEIEAIGLNFRNDELSELQEEFS